MGNTQSGVLRLEEVEHIFLKVGRHHGCEPGSTLVTAGVAMGAARSSSEDDKPESSSMWSITRWDYTSANAVAQEFVSSMSSKVSVI